MAQVPIAIRELTRFVPSMLMYSSIFAFLTFGSESCPSQIRAMCWGLGSWRIEGHCSRRNAAQTYEPFLLAQRTNACPQIVNLVLAEPALEPGHSTLAVRNYLTGIAI